MVTSKNHEERDKREKARINAIDLKSKGFRNCQIQNILKEKLDVYVTSRTITDWVSGRAKHAGISISKNKPKTQ